MVNLLHYSLRERQHILVRKLADCIESQWREHFSLSPYPIPKDLGYVEGGLEGEKLIIENHCYQTLQFRKLHLELARVGDRVDILHCVMFPRVNYHLPVFGTDIVASEKGVSAAIADLSPMTRDRSLSQRYRQGLKNLPRANFSQPRVLPEWAHIFSEFCLFVRPVNEEEEAVFLERVNLFLSLHCQIAKESLPLANSEAIAENLEGQNYYCRQQRQNDKTRRVLERSFGESWADRYMTTMLFDSPQINSKFKIQNSK
ncbi:MAG: phycocyanobilin:ferredoxin oxidoreductase [Cyanobacteria bacterium SBLK]|nr:phycocyanobilin:ferredoxin oxidoreductase [Cyanobacteria bacterium SBLK]